MSEKTVFDDLIGSSILANQNTEVVGPGRLARCREIQVAIDFASDCTAGAFLVQASHHQDFPGTPRTVSTINAPGAGGETEEVNLTGIRGFLRVRGNGSINGGGADSIYMRGN